MYLRIEKMVKNSVVCQTSLWQDCWLGACPLSCMFPYLFKIASQPEISVAKALAEGELNLEFRRQFDERQTTEFMELVSSLEEVELTEGRDNGVWLLEKSQKYSTKSLYNLETTCGVVDHHMMIVWKCNILLKVKNFIWMAVHDKIQCGVQLKKK